MRNSLSENRHFHQILLEKMSNPVESRCEKGSTRSNECSSQLAETGFFPLINLQSTYESMNLQSKIYRFNGLNAKFYNSPIKKPSQKNQLAKRKLEKKYKVSTLSTAAQLTLYLLGFNYDSQRLESVYVQISEVKTAFRQQARKLHPDLNPTVNCLEFAAIKQSTDALLAELASLSA